MEKDDHAELQARCIRLEGVLLCIEEVLDDHFLAIGKAKRQQLTRLQEHCSAELSAVNARLTAIRRLLSSQGPPAPTT